MFDDDELSDPNALHFDFPVWAVVDGRAPVAIELRFRTVALKTGDADRSVPLFTDEDLARTFVEGSGRPEWVPLAVGTKRELVELLRELEPMGVTHVGIDGPPVGSPTGIGWFGPIASVINQLSEQL